MRSLRSTQLRFVTVEMTCKENTSFYSLTLIVNKLQILLKNEFKNCIKNNIIHVTILSKTMPLTRHLDRSETEWRDLTTIICLQVNKVRARFT